jgi:hypothetical protein
MYSWEEKLVTGDGDNMKKEKRYFIRCCNPCISAGTGIWWQGWKTKKEAEENAKKCVTLGYLDITVEYRYVGEHKEALELVEK